MSELPLNLYKGQDVKMLDSLEQSHDHISGYQLMCRAGEVLLKVLQLNWPDAKTISILCGPGNNGGDGLVLARFAKDQGLNVKVYQVGDAAKSTPESEQA